MKFIDRASPALISRAAGNVNLPTVIISIHKPGENPVDFFKATLPSVSIERIEVSGDSGPLVEQVVLKPRLSALSIGSRMTGADSGPRSSPN